MNCQALIDGLPGHPEGQSFVRKLFRFRFVADSSTTPTLQTGDAGYEAIPDGARVLDGFSKVKKTFSGAAVASIEVGDAADPNRFGSTATMTINTEIKNATALGAPVIASSYAPLVTLDQAATAGEIVTVYVCEVPQFDHAFNLNT
jgi:hypothetical protein